VRTSFWLSLILLALSTTGCVEETSCEASCAGCCQGGLCLPGNQPLACGAEGRACDVCVAGQRCSASQTCEAEPARPVADAGRTCPTDAQLCSEARQACGALTVIDTCGATRTIASCGACTATQACLAGACVCQPESTAVFCQQLGSACGATSGVDRCGQPRTENCGQCLSPTTCNSANQCTCVPESDADLCNRRPNACGAVPVTDRCGQARLPVCGNCPFPLSCTAAGSCECPNVETDTALCMRLGKGCGAVSALDSCGSYRSVDCGTCSGLNNQCVQNQCVCVSETDSQFCGTSCGTLTKADTCGRQRTVVCGASCGLNGVCGARVSNQCSTVQISQVTQNALYDISGSGPNDIWVVGANGLILRWNGVMWSQVPSPTTAPIRAVYAASPTEAWASGTGFILRWNGTAWAQVTLPSIPLCSSWGCTADAQNYSFSGISGSGPQDVYVSGSRYSTSTCSTGLWCYSGVALRWDGASWSTLQFTNSAGFMGVWSGAPGQAWFVGADPYSGTYPTPPYNTVTVNLSEVAHFRDGGTVTELDGSRYPNTTSPFLQLHAVWGQWGQSAWAVGDSTVLYRDPLASTPWGVSLSSSFLTEYRDVWGAGANNVWIVGRAGNEMLFSRWDGRDHSRATIEGGPAHVLAGVWGVVGGDVWAISSQGAIVRLPP